MDMSRGGHVMNVFLLFLKNSSAVAEKTNLKHKSVARSVNYKYIMELVRGFRKNINKVMIPGSIHKL